MLEVHRLMSESLLAVMGQGASLRGAPCGDVNIEHGVQITGLDDNVISEKDVATIAIEFNPQKGDVLVHPDGTFKLDAKLADNGVNRRFILLAV